MNIIQAIPRQLIDQGEDKILKVLLQDADNNNRPLDLTDASDIVAELTNADNSLLAKQFTGAGTSATANIVGGPVVAGVQAFATLFDAGVNPVDGDTITINISGTPFVFEFDDNFSVSPGNILVAIVAGSEFTALNFKLAVDTNIGVSDLTTAVSIPILTLIAGANFPGSTGNAPTLQISGSIGQPYILTDFANGVDAQTNVVDGDTVVFTIGSGPSPTTITFEFDDNLSTSPGNLPVTIGLDLAASIDNLQAQIAANVPLADIVSQSPVSLDIGLTAGANFPGTAGNTGLKVELGLPTSGLLSITGTVGGFFQGGSGGSGDIVLVGDALLGEFTVKVVTAETDLLDIGFEQTLTIKITRPGGTEIHKLLKAYSVQAKTA